MRKQNQPEKQCDQSPTPEYTIMPDQPDQQ